MRNLFNIEMLQVLIVFIYLKVKLKKIFSTEWGLGIGDWGLGIGDWAQSPIPNPQSPIPNPHFFLIMIIINFTKKIL